MKTTKESFDYGILTAVMFLLLGGIVFIGSSSAATALDNKFTWSHYMMKQLMWAIMGIAGAVYFFRLPDEKLRKQVPWLLGGSILLLYLTFVPGLGLTINNANRWIKVFGTGLTIQPYEFVKIAYVIFLADLFGNEALKFTQKLMRSFGVTLLIVIALGKQPDLGGAIIICSIYAIALFIAGISYLWLIPMSLGAAAILTVYIMRSENKMGRIMAFLDPWKYAGKEGYHTINSLIAVGSGGLFGTGLSQGKQKNLFLSMPHTDYIFSTISEELGFLGACTVIGVFIYLMWKGVLVAMHVKENRHKYMAALLTFMIIIQVCINIGVAIGFMPAKGTTLPFISAGGSSLVVNIMCVGFLLALSKKAVGNAD